MKVYVKYILLSAFISLFAILTKAQTVELPVYSVLEGSKGQIKKDSSRLNIDNKFWNSPAQLNLTGYYRIKNIVTFSLREDSTLLLNTKFTASVDVIIYDTTKTGAGDSAVKTLTISYDSTKGASYNIKSVFTFYDGYKVKIKVKNNIVLSPAQTAGNITIINNLLRLENEMQIIREYNFSCSPANPFGLVLDSTGTLASQGEMQAKWNSQIATEYDLEWTYIDNESLLDTSLYKTAGVPDAKKIFTNNASRVTISNGDTAYRIPMLYENAGTLFARVRPVQVRPGSRRYEGNWSSDGTGTPAQFATFAGHENTLNWQATTSFAEEGKRKSVVQYYDGTLRSRQTVTKDNTTQTTIVAESLYDYQGRPVIQVLPAPTLKTIIGYTKDFNIAGINTPYDKNLYDTLINAQDYCLSPAPAMDSSSGAANYYSASNPLSSGTGAGNSIYKYVPKASGYAFTETRYEQDNTGRVKSQSGVGIFHTIGSGHETNYFYGNPGQEELDALFGTEAGYASHYFKNMVKDANGQYSISYVDMHGRTIATALAGKTPTGMDTLVSNINRTRTEKLADSTNNLQRGLVLESSRSIMVPTAGNYTFNYSLTPDSVSLKNCANNNICYDCLYNLFITVTDDCNNCRLPGKVAYVVIDSTFTGAVLDTLCNANVPYIKAFTLTNLPEGNYTITKRLEINQSKYRQYRDSVFLPKNTCKTFNDFYRKVIDSIKNGRDCSQMTCITCSARLGSFAAYRVTYLTEGGIALADSGQYRNEILYAYNQEKALCDNICQNGGDQINIRNMMLQDMSAPYGQYANPDSAFNSNRAYNIFAQVPAGQYQVWQNPAVIYYTEYGKKDSVLNDNGDLVPPNDPTVTQLLFISNFKNSWANSLIPYHPEYAKLIEYEKHSASQAWDQDFLSTDTYAAADAKGYLKPWGIVAGVSSPSYFTDVPLGYDPLAKTDSLLNLNLPAAVYNYQSINSVNYSMWGIASVTAKCPSPDNNSCYATYPNTSLNNCLNPAAFCIGESDMGWRAFRQMYANTKRKLLMQKLAQLYTISPPIPSYRTEYFTISDTSTLNYGGYISGQGTNTGAITADMQAKLQAFYQGNCQDYAQSWLTAMAPCNFDAGDSARLIPRMVQICVAGSDTAHSFGSSSTAPGSLLTYTSFETLIKHYVDSMHLIDPVRYNFDLNCNNYSIYYPTPYDQQVSLGEIPVWTKPDSCQCSQVTGYYAKYLVAHPADTTSFSTYLLQETGTSISNTDLTKLRNLCSGADTCKFMVTPIYLPPVLQCGIKEVCVDCIKMQKVLDSFKIVLPGKYPNYNFSDSAQLKINGAFANFANYKLGFNKQAIDYLGFMNQCGMNYAPPYPPLFSCDTIRQVLDTFKNFIYPNTLIPPLAYNADGCDTTNWYFPQTPMLLNGQLRYKDMFTVAGVVGLPTTVTDTVNGSNSPFELISTRPLCNLGGGFTIKIRIKAPLIPAANINAVLMGFVGNGMSQSQFTFIQDGRSYGVYNNVVVVPGLAETFADWREVKLVYKNNTIHVFIDDVPRFDTTYTGTITGLGGWGPQFGGNKGQVDYIKVYDYNDKIVLDEQFNSGCGVFALPKARYRCSSADCQTSFVNYFNAKVKGSFTFPQIDSIYRANCRYFYDPCKDTTYYVKLLIKFYKTVSHL